jgi:prepilin-type N-terminal cleavage/methylation domain-containing protein
MISARAHHLHPPRALRGGFTLIELIVVIVVLAIASVAIVPKFTGTARQEADNAVDQVAEIMRLFAYRQSLGSQQVAIWRDGADGRIYLLVKDGNPEDPVGIEFGVYERGEKITNFKKIIRAYLAGILQSREEIKALYKLDEKGGKAKVGRFLFEITPPTAPDSNGGWWLSIYEPGRLDQFRVSDLEYRKNTLPFAAVNHSSGELRSDRINSFDHFLSSTMVAWAGMIPNLRGFYRDSMGQLALITPESMKKKTKAPPAQ